MPSAAQSPADRPPPASRQNSHWINLADLSSEFVRDNGRRTASYADFRGLADFEESDVEAGCCCCFRRRRKRRRRRKGGPNGRAACNGSKYELVPPAKLPLATKSSSDDQIIQAYSKNSGKAKEQDGMSEEERRVLQMKADILNEKSDQFYKLLFNEESAAHENLLKYFEQDRGVLVLDCFFDDAFMIVAICTKRAKLMALKEDLASGSFCRDLEQCLVRPDVLAAIGVKAMKLAVDFDESEFREALAELS